MNKTLILVAATALTIGLPAAQATKLQDTPLKPALYTIRRGLPNTLFKLKHGNKVTIAYFGGSITAAEGWRVLTFDWFKKTYPRANLQQIHAAIGGTGSLLGVFRMDRDLLPHRPDLVFVEFAVNDGFGPFRKVIDQMEGIVRKIRKQYPETDICFFYTIHQRHFKDYDAGNSPVTIRAMEAVATHYGIPSINGGYKVYQLVKAGELGYPGITRNKSLPIFSKDACHPHQVGHKIYTEFIIETIRHMQAGKAILPHPLPAPLSTNNYENARMLAPSRACQFSSGWRKQTNHKYKNHFDELWTGKAGDSLSIRFKGTDLLLFDVVGPDTGQFELFVDGKRKGNILQYDKYCTYYRLHNTRLATNLQPDKIHEVTLKILPTPPTAPHTEMKSKGTHVNIGAILLRGQIVHDHH